MLHHQTTAKSTFLPFLGVFLVLGPPGHAEKKPIPSDLKIVAEYGCGYSDWASWKYTITADGKVAREIYDLNDTKKVSKLTEDDQRSLLEKIKEADFFTLKKRYDFSVTDNPTLVLSVTLDSKNHKVVVYAPDHQKKDKDIRRFFRVWSEILRKVPAPNPDQKPELYKP